MNIENKKSPRHGYDSYDNEIFMLIIPRGYELGGDHAKGNHSFISILYI